MALAEKAAGANGIQAGRAALTCGLAALVWVLTRPAGVLAGRILAVAPVLIVGNSAWSERPLLFSLLFMAVIVFLAERDEPPGWLALPVMWAWVNIHGSFPLALVYLGARLVGRRIDGRPLDQLPRLAALTAGGTLLGALNPLGPRLLVFPFDLLSRNDLLSRVSEWRSPNFSRPPNLALLAMMLVALLLCSRRRAYEDGLPAVVFSALAALAVRNSPLATIVLAPVLARGLSGLGTLRGEQRSGLTAVTSIGVLAVAGAVLVTSLQGPAYDLAKYPVKAVGWMEREGLLNRRVATEDFVGNYLISRRGTDGAVFFDDRFDMYPPRLIKDAILLLDGREGWQRVLDRYGVEVVLWQRARPLAGLLTLDPGWEVLHRDARWLVAARRD